MLLDRRRLLASAAAAAAAARFDTPSRALEAAPGLPKAEIQLAAAIDPATAPGRSLAYGAASPGRVFRVKSGANLAVTLRNSMSEPTSLDWHGLRLPGPLENVPGLTGSVADPGGEARWAFKPTEPGTSWIHPPFTPGWSDQTARGLAAVLIVEEQDAPEVDADEVIVVADRGDASEKAPSSPKPLSARLSIGGGPWPLAKTCRPGARLRLRLVNASTREALAAGFAGAEPLIVAIDGQPSELFRPLRDQVPLGPGARFDVMVDLPLAAGATFDLLLGPPGSTASEPAFRVRAEGDRSLVRPPIHSLTPNPTLPPVIRLEKARRVELTASVAPGSPDSRPGPSRVWSINGKAGTALPAKPLFTIRRNSSVTVGFTNASDVLSGFRLHGHVARLLHTLDDGWEPYWRDTILVAPRQRVHAAFVADRVGRWLIESPFFDQATGGLRAWFEVL